AKVKRVSDRVLLMDGVVPSYLTSLSAQKLKYMKGEADLLTLEPLMENIPESDWEMERLKYGVFHNPLIYGPLVSIDKKSTIIIADFRTGDRKIGEPEYFRTTPLEIYKGITEITEPENDSNTTVRCAGSPVIIGWVNSEGIPWIMLTFLCFLIVMCGALYFIFREWREVFLPILLGVLSTIWAFGLYSVILGNVFGSASCLFVPFIIMASATCHAVQFLKRYANEEYPRAKESKLAIINTFDKLWGPLLTALITDILAFAVLCVVPFTNVSLIGKIGALGLISLIIIFVIFFIPLLSISPGSLKEDVLQKSEASNNRNDEWLKKTALGLIGPKGKWAIVVVTVILIIPSIHVISRIDPGQDNTYAIHNYLTKSWENNPIYLMEMNIKEKFKGVYPCNLLIDTKKEDGLKDPEVLKAIDNFATYLQKNLPEVAGTMQIPTYLKLMNRFMNEEKEEYFSIPDDRKAISEYILMYTMGELGAFDSVVDCKYQKAPLALFVDSTSHETVRRVLTTIEDYVDKHFRNDKDIEVRFAGGSIGIAGAFNDSIKKWIILSLVLSVIASMIMVLIIFRSFLAAIFLIIAPLLAVVVTFALLQLSGVEINSNIAVVASMGIGVGIDAVVYLLFRFKEEFRVNKNFEESIVKSFMTAGKANIASYFALVLGCWSVIPVPLYLGYTGYGLGMVLFLNLLITLSTIISLWAIFKPKFLFK
ncbi:MAG: MMPL family transporter, partial [Deltaproteobacteria bacterium]|nr:MMPL family transporter [Deltaproteobacteria bacterium]